MIDRYAKQRIFLGGQADARLRSRRVAVVGLGATGSVIAAWLARAGVGHLTLIDLSTVLSQLVKWSYNGTSWSQTGFISSSASNLAGVVTGSNVTLYLTSPTTLSTLTDTSGQGGTLNGTLTSLATAGTYTAFRGIGILPEPASLLLLGLGVALIRRR